MRSAIDLIAALDRSDLSPLAALEQSLDRIDLLEAGLDAWVHIDAAGARARARSLGRTREHAALYALPVGVKDIIDVAGLPTRMGAEPFAHHVAQQDAPAVARLRTAGAVLLGKTATTQFAYLDPAPTHNPWHSDRTPGGSSSGSAAAVASGMVPLALGTQTVGSVLRPAAYCGVVGLKATHGRISTSGAQALAPSFDHVGAITTCVADAALALSVLAGYDAGDAHSIDWPVDDYVTAIAAPAAPRIGLARHYYEGVASEELARHLQDVAQRLAGAGASVADVEMPRSAQALLDLGQPVMRYEAARAHERWFSEHAGQYASNIRALLEAGLATSVADYEHALAELAALRSQLTLRLAELDVLLLPVAPGTAPGIDSTGSGIFCAPASFSGLPSISLPSGIAADGLPLAVQLVAAPWQESRLLAAAAWVERLLDFHAEPPLPDA